jgi:hypothetical protein
MRTSPPDFLRSERFIKMHPRVSVHVTERYDCSKEMAAEEIPRLGQTMHMTDI